MGISLVKNFTEREFLDRFDLWSSEKRVLNAGSSSMRYGRNFVNIDIQAKPEVDVVCDLHSLPDSLGHFDAVICNGVLQYCHTPQLVAEQLYRVMNPNGVLFIDAPWVQPYCPDTPDRFRYSEAALRGIFSAFEVIETGISIRPGSAFYMLGVHIAETLTHNRYINFAAGRVARVLLYPFRWIRTADESMTGGACYLIGRKRP